ncbi:MAG: hypothetical protein Q9209_001091 [Squamulea sp. 1 TL-2023]
MSPTQSIPLLEPMDTDNVGEPVPPPTRPTAMPDLMETDQKEQAVVFPYYKAIPRRVQKERCAMIINHEPTPPIIGRVGRAPNNWSLELLVDAGTLRFPSFSMSANVRSTPNGKPFSKDEKEVFDTTTLRWLPAEAGDSGELMINHLSYQPFPEWLKEKSNLPNAGQEIIQEVTALEKQQQAHVTVLTCVLMGPKVVEFTNNASWSRVDPIVQAQLETLEGSKVSVSFIFDPKDGRLSKNHMPIFKRRVNESFGVLSQYIDPESGDSLLQKVQETPTV